MYINELNKYLAMLMTQPSIWILALLMTIHTPTIYSELVQVQTWINANKLSLNVQKSNHMIISKINHIENVNISLSGQPVARTSNHRFLGVFINDKLKFDIHINKLCSKVSKSNGIMRRISHLVPLKFYKMCIIRQYIQESPMQSLHGDQY